MNDEREAPISHFLPYIYSEGKGSVNKIKLIHEKQVILAVEVHAR